MTNQQQREDAIRKKIEKEEQVIINEATKKYNEIYLPLLLENLEKIKEAYIQGKKNVRLISDVELEHPSIYSTENDNHLVKLINDFLDLTLQFRLKRIATFSKREEKKIFFFFKKISFSEKILILEF